MKYYVSVAGREVEVSVAGESVRLNGDEVRASLQSLPGTPVELVSVDNRIHRILARRSEAPATYEISIDGFRLTARALDSRARAIRALSGGKQGQAGPAALLAPMPGLIVGVRVKEGDAVRAGQGLVVMEAMKMENELRAGASGVVRRILVSVGATVEKGAVLLEVG